MLLACILFVGSVTAPNPALMGMPAPSGIARGVQRITRHPMMWAFALWAVVHGGLAGSGRTVLLAGAILILALVGARLQDGKKRGQMGDAWRRTRRRPASSPSAGGSQCRDGSR